MDTSSAEIVDASTERTRRGCFRLKPNSTTSSKATKNVDFLKVVRVCLIPCREEFEPIKHTIWWDTDDYETFKSDAFFELFATMKTHKCTLKEGISILYGPHSHLVSSSSPESCTHLDFEFQSFISVLTN